MQFLYHPESGQQSLLLEGEEYRYLFKVRRTPPDEILFFRNLEDSALYHYRIDEIGKKQAKLGLLKQENKACVPKKQLHIGWCMIDPKSIEKTLPMLNEMGVAKISFIYCERSQKSYKIDFERLKRILISSSQQCGRTDMMQLELLTNLQSYLENYPQSYMLHFSEKKFEKSMDIQTVLIGCEGGFTEDEMIRFQDDKIVGLESEMILKSESAVAAVAAKALL